MWKRIKNNFDSGIERIKWFSSILSERMKIEFSVIKLVSDRDKKEKDRAEKLRLIGERVFELKEQHEKNVLKDKAITTAISEIEKLNSEIEDLKKKASEVSKVEG
jgi:acetate kinase